MKSVYLLFHIHYFPDGEEDDKLLGVYSTKEIAEKKIEEKYKKMPGCCEPEGEFIIDEYKIDQDRWGSGFVTVFPGEKRKDS